MYAQHKMLQYQQQSVSSASPEQLILKLYDLGITSCHRGDQGIYEFCLNDSALGELGTTAEILGGLRDAWREGVMRPQAA